MVVDLRPRQSLRMDQTSEEIKHEARVLARVKHLQKEGLWSGGRLDKKLAKGPKEPSVPRTHWGYVLEEMEWMANVFQVRRNDTERFLICSYAA